MNEAWLEDNADDAELWAAVDSAVVAAKSSKKQASDSWLEILFSTLMR